MYSCIFQYPELSMLAAPLYIIHIFCHNNFAVKAINFIVEPFPGENACSDGMGMEELCQIHPKVEYTKKNFINSMPGLRNHFYACSVQLPFFNLFYGLF